MHKRANTMIDTPLILGLDFGTSGLRGVLVPLLPSGASPNPLASFQSEYPSTNLHQTTQAPESWIQALENLSKKIPSQYKSHIEHIIVDATSSTVLLYDPIQKVALTPALMYHDPRARLEAQEIEQWLLSQNLLTQGAPISTALGAALGASSTLSKVTWLLKNGSVSPQAIICHQIDFINGYLTGEYQITDENNALKLGYDPISRNWPDWVQTWLSQWKLPLPEVNAAGTPLAKILPATAQKLKLPEQCQIYCGTTDSIAAFYATGAQNLGDAVTSLGSTLAIKMLVKQPIYDSRSGLYSHRVGNQWLVGGASNTGGAILLKYFSLNQLSTLSNQLDLQLTQEQLSLPKLSIPTGLNYYPLAQRGERFPISDAELLPKVTPRPEEDTEFLLGLIEGLVNIEKQAYQILQEQSRTPLHHLYTVGGGTQNPAWQRLRQQVLTDAFSVDIKKPLQNEAAFGVTQLLKF